MAGCGGKDAVRATVEISLRCELYRCGTVPVVRPQMVGNLHLTMDSLRRPALDTCQQTPG